MKHINKDALNLLKKLSVSRESLYKNESHFGCTTLICKSKCSGGIVFTIYFKNRQCKKYIIPFDKLHYLAEPLHLDFIFNDIYKSTGKAELKLGLPGKTPIFDFIYDGD